MSVLEDSSVPALSMLSDDDKSVIGKVFNVVLSHEAFCRYTGFANVLHNTLTEPSTTYTDVEAFLSRLSANATGTQDLQQLRDAIASVANVTGSASPNTALATQLYQSPTCLIDKIIERYSVAFPTIGPASGDTVPHQYVDAVHAVCAHTYYVVYQQLYSTLQNTSSSHITSFPFISLSSLENICTRLSTAVTDNVSLHPSSDTVDDYINKCYRAIYSTAVNANLIPDPINCELYAACFLPYFVIQYITGFIAMPTITAANKAPRSATVRRIAILCAYEFQLYLLYTAYQLSARYAPASRQTYELRMILDMNVTQVYDDEASYVQDEDAVKRMHDTTRATFEKNDSLAQLARDVDAARSSYNSIRSNELQLDAQVRRSAAWRIVWLVVLIVYALAVLASVCTGHSGTHHAVFGASLVLALVVVVVGLVAVLRSSGVANISIV